MVGLYTSASIRRVRPRFKNRLCRRSEWLAVTEALPRHRTAAASRSFPSRLLEIPVTLPSLPQRTHDILSSAEPGYVASVD